MISRSLVALVPAFIAAMSATPSVVASPAVEIQQREIQIRLIRIREDPRYFQTRLLCENNWREYGWVLNESASEMVLLGFLYAPAWSRFFQNRRIAPDVLDLLESEAFTQALLDCGDDSVIQKMAAADYAGKVIGLAATYALWRSSGPLLIQLAKQGNGGLVAQRLILVLGVGYTVHQGILLADIVRNQNASTAESKALIERKSQVIQRNIASMRQEVESGFRKELAQLESELQKPELPDADRIAIGKKIERIRFALNANEARR